MFFITFYKLPMLLYYDVIYHYVIEAYYNNYDSDILISKMRSQNIFSIYKGGAENVRNFNPVLRPFRYLIFWFGNQKKYLKRIIFYPLRLV